MMIAIVPFVLAAIGLVMFLAGEGKVARVGEILLLAGVIGLALVYAGHVVHVG